MRECAIKGWPGPRERRRLVAVEWLLPSASVYPPFVRATSIHETDPVPAVPLVCVCARARVCVCARECTCAVYGLLVSFQKEIGGVHFCIGEYRRVSRRDGGEESSGRGVSLPYTVAQFIECCTRGGGTGVVHFRLSRLLRAYIYIYTYNIRVYIYFFFNLYYIGSKYLLLSREKER